MKAQSAWGKKHSRLFLLNKAICELCIFVASDRVRKPLELLVDNIQYMCTLERTEATIGIFHNRMNRERTFSLLRARHRNSFKCTQSKMC